MDMPYMHTVWLCLVVSTMGSVVQLFIFRWQNLLVAGDPLKVNKRFIYVACTAIFFLFNVAVTCAGLTIKNRVEELRPQYLQNYSCISSLDGIPGFNYFEMEELRRLFLVSTVEAFIVVVASCLLIHLTFRSLRDTNISQKTIDMQRKFQKSLILQVTTPVVVVIIPGCSVMSLVCWADFRAGGSMVIHIQGMYAIHIFLSKDINPGSVDLNWSWNCSNIDVTMWLVSFRH
ncbi:hypothetical protein Y032_0083g1616 [Ancylostoma ceylanicum]|uniref:G protein-coupled receptor n=2 Tax=Ancylostoma ceylanicum TaxID=53326 RepID=A0A016TQX0_9BILA|nr:hypothetical protein Y032_0083g1616 [Ancylostoma ceylanicum]